MLETIKEMFKQIDDEIRCYYINLSNIDNVSETICWGPWMAAWTQYSFTCWSIFLQMWIIVLDEQYENEIEKLIWNIVFGFSL